MSNHDGDRVPVELHIVSDSTGETAQRLVLALEAQFPDQPFEEIRHARVENVEDLHIAVQQARGRPAVMVYTLVAPELRDAMRQLCRRARVHYCDLLGHPIDSISRVAGVAARMEPGARAPLDSTYFKRIEAIEFAVKYDDGVGKGLDEADIVLVGVSRTSKTPLSIFLGYLGHKAANVPVVRGIDPPEELFEIDPAKIVGLTIDAERLARHPHRAGAEHGAPRKRYAELEVIYAELEEAAKLHRRLALPRHRRHRALGRGDSHADHPARRAPKARDSSVVSDEAPPEPTAVRRSGEPPLANTFRPPPGGTAICARRGGCRSDGWRSGGSSSFLGDLVFYVLLTPIWLGLRAAARLAELRSRVGAGPRKRSTSVGVRSRTTGKRASSDRVPTRHRG